MIAGMTTKIAVSLPDEQVEAARAAVAEGRAPSVSAYVSDALARRSAEDELLQLLDEDETQEPATDEHRAWAGRALRGDDADTAPRRRTAIGPSAKTPHRHQAAGSARRRSEVDRAGESADGSAGQGEGPRRRPRGRQSTSDGTQQR
jgi:Arc/MetJ-type ribon-helix-helix transcriptional regulator